MLASAEILGKTDLTKHPDNDKLMMGTFYVFRNETFVVTAAQHSVCLRDVTVDPNSFTEPCVVISKKNLSTDHLLL